MHHFSPYMSHRLSVHLLIFPTNEKFFHKTLLVFNKDTCSSGQLKRSFVCIPELFVSTSSSSSSSDGSEMTMQSSSSSSGSSFTLTSVPIVTLGLSSSSSSDEEIVTTSGFIKASQSNGSDQMTMFGSRSGMVERKIRKRKQNKKKQKSIRINKTIKCEIKTKGEKWMGETKNKNIIKECFSSLKDILWVLSFFCVSKSHFHETWLIFWAYKATETKSNTFLFSRFDWGDWNAGRHHVMFIDNPREARPAVRRGGRWFSPSNRF